MKIAKVLFVAFSGLRIKNPKLLALGWKSPELRHRSYTISSLPSLGLLTLAGLTPDTWQCKYIEYSEDSID
ncbi:hypothetical protein MJH12_15110 [bacterium]|nr:hypothetical protein [bacterium]